jgi:hypothetical protein
LTGRYNGNIVVKNRYFKVSSAKNGGKKATGKKLNAHFKYIEYRPKDEQSQEQREDRFLFDAESDHITRKDAVNNVMEHTHSRVAYHAMILSPDPQEPVNDLRQWTRDIMHDFAEQQGKEIHWYAVQHYNTLEHPHVHVVIAGGGEVPNQEKLAPVTIYEKELRLLHESGLEHSDHELYQQLDEMHRDEMQELAAMQQEQELIHTFEGRE